MSVKATLDAHGLAPRKRWGQNFLTDEHLLETIADAAELTPADTVLEIGPGLGHLTRVLARRAGRVVAVELDPALAAQLTADFAGRPNIRIVHSDVLAAEPIAFLNAGEESGEGARRPGTGPAAIDVSVSAPFKVVANLPYYITSAILRHVLESSPKPRLVVVMVQREVAQRMAAHPPEMNLLAVGVQLFARVRIVRTIPAGAFYPRPQVDSAIVRLDVIDPPPFDRAEAARFFDLVRAGFGERRKQLRNALAHGLAVEPATLAKALSRARIDPARRAETLSLHEWGALHRELEHR